MKHHIFLVVFSFLFTGLCTAQAQKSWWQLAYEEEQSISALFDENKFDQQRRHAEKQEQSIKLSGQCATLLLFKRTF
ncbi:hypothetical protein IPH67_03825 [bacterium]|nr:MAG: hypothetical protein IPH67_03825 [bacterium]